MLLLFLACAGDKPDSDAPDTADTDTDTDTDSDTDSEIGRAHV